MASRCFHALFLQARDRYAGASRWTYLAVLVLAVLHLAVVTPYVDSRHLESAFNLEIDRLAGVDRGLAELGSALDEATSEILPEIRQTLDHLVEDIEQDLSRLDATRNRIAARAMTEGAENQLVPENPAPSAGGEDRTAAPSVLPFQLENPDWVADLRDARTRDELLTALAPIVDELITQPSYFDAERSWQDSALPRLEARLEAAAGAVPRLRNRFPESGTRWLALVGAINELRRAARQLRLAPPQRPFWWSTPALDGGLALALTDETQAAIRRPEAVAELERLGTCASELRREIGHQVTQARRAVGEGPGDRGSGDLEVAAVVPMFPLFLGLILSGAVIRRSQLLRELGLTTELAIAHGSPAALRRWLWSQAQWSTPPASAPAAWRRSVVQTLLAYFLALGWVALVAVQLRQLQDLDRLRLMVVTFTGATLVLAACVHRLLVSRRAIFPLDLTDPSPVTVEARREVSAPATDASEPATGLIEARPLRR